MSKAPQSDLVNMEPDVVTEIVTSLNELRSWDKPKNDGEIEQRIDEYFRWCERTGSRCGVESLCAALHISRSQLWQWEHGNQCSTRRSEAVQRAKSFIACQWEQCFLRGKVNPVSGIFVAKNWFGYRDSYEVNHDDTKQDTGIESTPEEIAARYATATKPKAPDLSEWDE